MTLDQGRLRRDWIQTNLKIMDRHARISPLNLNVGQLMFFDVMDRIRKAKQPVRIVLLKPRRVGWTTASCADAFFESWSIQNWRSMVVSVDADSTENVFRMIHLFNEELAEDLRRPMDATNRKEIIFSAPHRSSLLAQTAGKVALGRSYEARHLLCSEVAYWADAENQLASLYQIVPLEEGTTIILESTANGQGGSFYDTFWQAVDHYKQNKGQLDGAFVPVFFPWYKFPEYSLPVRGEFKKTEEELDLVRRYKITDNQLNWRRAKLGEINGDMELFARDYPSSARDAFRTSGNPVFTPDQVDYQASTVSLNPRRCLIIKESGSYRPMDVDQWLNCWFIRELPRSDEEYVIGCDTMEARLSDVQNVKSKLDYDALAVLKRATGDVVAIWHGRMDQTELAKQAFNGCKFYGDAWFIPEIPNAMITLAYFKDHGYQNIYNRSVHDDTFVEQDSEVLGWRTTTTSRPWLVNNLQGACNDRSINMGFEQAVGEMRTFIRDKSGKAIHMAGEHDDILFAIMLALQGHLKLPYQDAVYHRDRTGEFMKKGENNLDKDRVSSIGYSGSVDRYDPEIDDDNDEKWSGGDQIETV